MNVIFTCGGTGGHINPAIAVANIWKERHPDSKILFIGGKGGMEEQLVPQAGYELIDHGPQDYDAFLSSLYGNYMELPPEDKRENRHQIQELDLGE